MCSNIALTLLVASITQMLRATLILFTAVFAVLILKMKLYKHHYASLIIIVVGLCMVGSSQLFEEQPGGEIGDQNTSVMIIGVVVLLIGQVFGSLSYIFEEKFLSDFEDVHPYIVVGWEGLWGTIIMFIMLVFLQLIPCSD